eukprot:CAMPEP_0182909108 /NCGR_PEP_ID=MMETSP0034_2-20130328/35576_1 /TAXON_ID=156128 /ORGANISM="Nephroselmis pyriformis, Strain CCMP717" /LENGTH=59 /DNA_ID=CAMNT_0025045339 /DNA_START=42 /DNA_END=218 /DNA_ORIENTATION=+
MWSLRAPVAAKPGALHLAGRATASRAGTGISALGGRPGRKASLAAHRQQVRVVRVRGDE